MCYIDGQKNKYSVLNECNRMLKYNMLLTVNTSLSHTPTVVDYKTGEMGNHFGENAPNDLPLIMSLEGATTQDGVLD
jgi:hypothetical protein